MNRGLVALGDSITHGHGEPMLGVHCQSWAQWLAEALGLPFTNLAVDGARAGDVMREQVVRLAGPYDIGALYVGVNDARDPAWNAAAYARELEAVLAVLTEECDVVLVCTLPEDLGRPSAAPKPATANAIVRAAAERAGAQVVALDDFAGPAWTLPDAVHATAAGQVEIARRAQAVTGRAPQEPLPEADRSRGSLRGWRRRRAVLGLQELRRRLAERWRSRTGRATLPE